MRRSYDPGIYDHLRPAGYGDDFAAIFAHAGRGLLVGLVVSVFQATTQIQEMTLQFSPPILAIMGALVVAAPRMLEKLMGFTSNILQNFPEWARLGAGVAASGLTP